MGKIERKIDVGKTYSFPRHKIISFNGLSLVIAVETANWIVLDNSEQLNFFKLLEKKSIQDSLDLFQGDEKNAKWVLIQLEAKNFERRDVNSIAGDSLGPVHIYLTNSCNMRCPHCYMYAGSKKNNELSTLEITAMLEGLSKAGITDVTFSGGEVLMRNDFVDLVNSAYAFDLKTRILTNGVLWTKDLVEHIGPKIDSVQISIDGYSEESNSPIRGNGSFEKALSTVDWFTKVVKVVEIAVTPFYSSNLSKEIDNYVSFSKRIIEQYGQKVRLNFSKEVIEGREVKLTKEQKKEYFKCIDEIQSRFYNEKISDYVFVKAYQDGRILDNCMYGDLSISSNGDVYLCSRVPSIKPIGNIRCDSISSLIEKAKRGHIISNIKNLKPCNSCELMYICGGGCRIDNFEGFSNLGIDKCDQNTSFVRRCDITEKEYYYDLMVRTNTKFFK